MKISGLINRLEKIQGIYGDIECITVDYIGGEYDENEPGLALSSAPYGLSLILNV